MWNLAAKAKMLASQHFAYLHRIKFPLHNIFFQNNTFFMGSKMDTAWVVYSVSFLASYVSVLVLRTSQCV